MDPLGDPQDDQQGGLQRVPLRQIALAAIGGAALIVVFEADHTDHLPPLTAFALWVTHLFAILLLFLAALRALQRFGVPTGRATLLSLAVTPLPFAALSLMLDYGFGNAEGELANAPLSLALYLEELQAVLPVCLTISGLCALLLQMRRRAVTRPSTTDDSPTDPNAPRQAQPTTTEPDTEKGTDKHSQSAPADLPLHQLFEGVPPALGEDVIRLHAQDHYVEVVTTQGRCLLSVQFGDCIARLAGRRGAQCHRSHWINLAHVKDIRRKGSAYVCWLSNGDSVPVSRRRYSALRADLQQKPATPPQSQSPLL
ncbi:LytTR family DNA-binding domain-containing protein [Phaeobacter sp.]|uniref:LytTR family DNA-binding domain-containing protein n=1 Tax=Phaeobacter sp. TaxID=1902409 RepID=UPI0025F5EFA3|nr:LytTR family DNA-binding domain-containing protein [Phaeobacter sp.]